MSWIKISDRAPTDADLGPLKNIEFFCLPDGMRQITRSLYWGSSRWTHWRTVDLPPPPAKELTQRERDKEDAETYAAQTYKTANAVNRIFAAEDHLAGIYAERRAIKEIVSIHGLGGPITSLARKLLERLNEQGGEKS